MIATHNQTLSSDDPTLELISDTSTEKDQLPGQIKNLNSSPLLLSSRSITHAPKAGLNPLVDAAGYLFSVLGTLKQLKAYRQPSKLQKELIQEITQFQETVKNQGYNAEYIMVCRYLLSATFDDIISNTSWGGQGQWESYSLLSTFNQDTQHQDKFFTILERAIKEPALYIDLMEFIYICLSMGYKGQYRSTEHSQYQLEQITNNLYKHIRAYRGSFSKTLSPSSFKTSKTFKKSAESTSPLFLFFVTGCIIMSIFVSLAYLMDVISNEAYQHIEPAKKPMVIKTTE